VILSRAKNSYIPFVIPGLGLLFLLVFLPILQSIYASFTQEAQIPTNSAEFVGLAHYLWLFSQDSFWTSLKLAAVFTLVSTFFEILIALGVSLYLYFLKPIPRIFEILLILPMFVLPVVSGLTFRYIYDPNSGPLSYLFERLSMDPIAPLSDSFWAFWAIILQDIWRMWPFVFLIIYAGLKSLPKSSQEAARIDGAGTKDIIFHILLPALKPTILVAIGLKVTESLKVFTEVYVMTGGGPGDSTSLLSIYVVKQAFHFFRIGPASAASVILLLLGISLAIGITKLQNRSSLKGQQ
jgi:multiple sugar transport system permease protein